jgi:hypothetical protein
VSPYVQKGEQRVRVIHRVPREPRWRDIVGAWHEEHSNLRIPLQQRVSQALITAARMALSCWSGQYRMLFFDHACGHDGELMLPTEWPADEYVPVYEAMPCPGCKEQERLRRHGHEGTARPMP